MTRRFFNPATWVSLMPNGIGHVKPNHYWEMVKVIWRNRRELPFAWRILNRGVCDGCALGTTGMHDFTMKGTHLCLVRLGLLPLNTMGPLDTRLLEDAAALSAKSSGELRDLGRLPYPMIRRRGDRGFRRISWSDALETIAQRLRVTDPKRVCFYVTSRGLTNEVYYAAQKVARFLGTNNVDNSSRICHAPSTVAMKQSLGVAASTCSYKDWIGTDLLVFIGSDVANNQPVTTKYMYYAKQRGTKIVVINPLKEPGLERYWIPSVFESALFGTKLGDEFFQIHQGGDIAFLNGVLKRLIERDWIDRQFVAEHTSGFEQVQAALAEQTWEELERYSGTSRAEMCRLAEMYSKARSAVFVWSMGITQHAFGAENVKAIVNLAISRGMLGREHCGVMPIRGHSGVQGSAEVGAVPAQFPGGEAVSEESARRIEALWKFPVPSWKGMMAVEMIDAAHRGEIDALYSIGGNFLETLPDPPYVKEAIERVPLRIHQDIVVTSQMLSDPADTVVLLPAQTRYEQRGGGTETSTERYIYFSPEIPGRRIGESKPEWEILQLVAEHTYPERRDRIHFENAAQIREEIAKAVPAYAGIEKLRKQGDAVQWGGRWLCRDGTCGTEDGRARFTPLTIPEVAVPEGQFFVSTRRGKQFNSMIQADRDPLTGAWRDDVMISREDASALGLEDGDPVLLRSDTGEFSGRVKIVPIKPRNMQVHWPEGNVLIRRGCCDPSSGIPDYNAKVELIPLGRSARVAGAAQR